MTDDLHALVTSTATWAVVVNISERCSGHCVGECRNF